MIVNNIIKNQYQQKLNLGEKKLEELLEAQFTTN